MADKKYNGSVAKNKGAELAFSVIRQGKSTNALTKVNATKANTDVDAFTGLARIDTPNIRLAISDYSVLSGLKTSTYQLLDAIIIKFTEGGAKSPTVVISVNEYMDLRELRDRKEARQQIVKDLSLLAKTSISWNEKMGQKTIPYAEINLVDSWFWTDKKKTSIKFTFGQTFYRVLLRYPIMAYPLQLQTLNNKKNPNSYYLLRKIAEQKNMNIGKKNEDVISVQTLLENAPFLPSYDEVMKGDRAINRRIVKPFERDMDILSDTLTWNYCYSYDDLLSEEEIKTMDYNTFRELLIQVHWKEYPDQTKRIAKITSNEK